MTTRDYDQGFIPTFADLSEEEKRAVEKQITQDRESEIASLADPVL